MRVSEIKLVSPRTIEECLSFLSVEEEEVRLIAGGTDAVVRMKDRAWLPHTWINMKEIRELRYIREETDGIHIGPLCTFTDIVNSPILQDKANVLVQAALEVGAPQIRNMGTIGGNIGTASPAGDTLPALYVLDTELELISLRGKRKVSIEDFFIGPGKTMLKKDEMISDILIRPHAADEISIFEKLGLRAAQAISIVNVAISLRMGSEPRECLGGKIAFGSVAPTIIRANKCEAMLAIQPLTDELIANIAKVAWKEVAPISDIRASAEYRRDMTSALLERGLYRLMWRWEKNEQVNSER